MATIDLRGAVLDAYLPYLGKCPGRYLVLYGGAGSGKSYFAATKVIKRGLEQRRRMLIIRKVGRTLRDSCWNEIRDQLHLLENQNQETLAGFCKINKSDYGMALPNGTELIFRGMDDREKVKSVKGIDTIWVEEATELNREDFIQLDLRLRGVSDPLIILTFNPVSANHWLKKHFFDQDRDATILKTTYQDNRFLDPGYRELLENLKEEDFYFYQVYALGEWGTLGELILTNYVVEKYDTAPEHFKNVNSGLDFGFTAPSALLQIGERDGDLYILAELYRAKLTNQELIDLVEEEAPQVKGFPVIGDSAEPDRIKEFQQRGFKITGAKKGRGYKKFAIDTLRRKRIHIHPDFINFRNEIGAWQYKKTADGTVLEEPVEFNDHLMDALLYGTEYLRAGPRKVKVGKFPGYR